MSTVIDAASPGTAGLRARLWPERTLAVTRAGPLLACAGVLVALASSTFADPYWLDLTSKSTTGLLVLAPGLAAACAWDASRWRILGVAAARSRSRQLLLTLTPAVLATACSYGVSLVILGVREHPEAGVPSLSLVATSLLAAAAYASSGFALGSLLPRFYAVAAAFAWVWLWLAFTPTIEPFWLRNVTANLGSSCCGIDTSLAPHALLAPSLTALGLGALAVALLRDSNHRLIGAASGFAVLLGCVSAAGFLVRDLGPDPVVPRTGDQVCVHPAGGPTLCAWPEHGSALSAATPALVKALDRLQQAGFRTSGKLVENHASGPDRLSYSLVGARSDEWVSSLALSPLAGLPPSCTESTGGHWPANAAYEPVGVWLLVTAGVRPADARAMLGATRSTLLVRLMRKSPADQDAWVHTALAAMATCTQGLPR